MTKCQLTFHNIAYERHLYRNGYETSSKFRKWFFFRNKKSISGVYFSIFFRNDQNLLCNLPEMWHFGCAQENQNQKTRKCERKLASNENSLTQFRATHSAAHINRIFIYWSSRCLDVINTDGNVDRVWNAGVYLRLTHDTFQMNKNEKRNTIMVTTTQQWAKWNCSQDDTYDVPSMEYKIAVS